MVHKNNSPFFKRNHKDWSLSEYLSFRHRPRLSPRQILDGWRKSLSNISTCTSSSPCCTNAQRLKATELLARYKELGNGSDQHLGKSWLTQKLREKPPVTSAIHFGPVYQGPVLNAPFTQTNHSPLNSQTNSDTSDETYEPSDHEDLVSDIGIDQHDDSELEKEVIAEASTNKDEELSAARTAFMDTYTAMNKRCMWLLASSGRTVEGVIFGACNAMDDELFANSLAQSFIIDVTDLTVKDWFETAEWDEIQSHVLPLPKPDVLMIGSMRRFLSVNTTDELRNILRTTDYLPAGVSYNRSIHYNSQWVDLVIRMFLALFENPDEPLCANYHLEDWYTSNIWSMIIDHCLIDLQGMTIERKESSCRATSVRKNRNRTMTGKAHRLKTGCRLDAIIRTIEDNSHEYGGMEVARSFRDVTSSKWLGDDFKLTKALRDMLFRLHELVDHDKSIVKKLQVVGVLNAGLALQITHMNHPNGYVCLLQREKLQHVPTNVQNLMKLLQLLKRVSQMKQIIKDCAAVVRGRQAGKTEEEKFNELIGEEVSSDKARLGWAADSP